jgi:hypothetical protein
MTRRGIASSLLLLGACVAACSLLTNPEQGEIRCKVSDEEPRLDPCPEGMYCINKTCKAQAECKRDDDGKVTADELCTDGIDNDCDDHVDERNDDVPERCDGLDNNCDGVVDEGFDTDGDGWTKCGEGFVDSKYDCNIDIASVHPDALETCEGLNNDCDNDTDEATPGKELCDNGQACVRGACVKPSCAVPEATEKACGPGEECIEERCVAANCQPSCGPNEYCLQQPVPVCMPIVRKKIGEGCSTDADCETALLCIGRDALRLTEGSLRGVCSRACCKDSECTGPEETCFASGSGTRACLPRTRAANSTAAGVKPIVCSAIEDCPSGQVCAPALVTSTTTSATLATPVCRAPGATDRRYANLCGQGEAAEGSRNCASRMCVNGNFLQTLCTTPCRSSKDCAALEAAAKVSFSITPTPPSYCQYTELSAFNPLHARNYAPVCVVARAGIGKDAPGATCQRDSDCADNVCIGASSEGKGWCAPVCCNDTQCSQIRAGMRCRPVVRGTGRYEMRCSP